MSGFFRLLILLGMRCIHTVWTVYCSFLACTLYAHQNLYIAGRPCPSWRAEIQKSLNARGRKKIRFNASAQKDILSVWMCDAGKSTTLESIHECVKLGHKRKKTVKFYGSVVIDHNNSWWTTDLHSCCLLPAKQLCKSMWWTEFSVNC